jgi:hypothetical protein
MGREPWAGELRLLLNLDAVAGHDLVHGELLAGDRGDKRRALSSYGVMQQAETIPHDEVVTFMQARQLYGRGAGWIDIHLLASALAGHMELWTADNALSELATELGIAYKVGRRGLYLLPK